MKLKKTLILMTLGCSLFATNPIIHRNANIITDGKTHIIQSLDKLLANHEIDSYGDVKCKKDIEYKEMCVINNVKFTKIDQKIYREPNGTTKTIVNKNKIHIKKVEIYNPQDVKIDSTNSISLLSNLESNKNYKSKVRVIGIDINGKPVLLELRDNFISDIEDPKVKDAMYKLLTPANPDIIIENKEEYNVTSEGGADIKTETDFYLGNTVIRSNGNIYINKNSFDVLKQNSPDVNEPSNEYLMGFLSGIIIKHIEIEYNNPDRMFIKKLIDLVNQTTPEEEKIEVNHENLDKLGKQLIANGINQNFVNKLTKKIEDMYSGKTSSIKLIFQSKDDSANITNIITSFISMSMMGSPAPLFSLFNIDIQ